MFQGRHKRSFSTSLCQFPRADNRESSKQVVWVNSVLACKYIKASVS